MSPKAVKGPLRKFGNNPKNFKGNKYNKNVRRFGRKGNHGQGTHIDDGDYAYYLGILETQQSKRFQSTDEEAAMANIVLQETKTKEIHVSSNQLGSRVLESVLGYSGAEHLERFFDVFGEDMRPLCFDDHAKHVINKLLQIAFIRARAKSVVINVDENFVKKKPKNTSELRFNLFHDFTDEHREKCSEFVLRISKFLLNNLEDFAESKNANHLIPTAMLCLAGIYIPSTILYKGKPVKNTEKYTGLKILHRVGKFDLLMTTFNVSDEWLSVMNEFSERVQMWPQFKDFPYNYRRLIQTMCIVLSHVNKPAFESLGMKLVNEYFVGVEVPMSCDYHNDPRKTNNVGNGDNDGEEKKFNGNDEEADADENENEADEHKTKPAAEEEDDDRPSVFKSDAGIRLLETLIPLATPKLKTEIIKLFEGRLLALALGTKSTFAVERLINYADKSIFEQLFDEISPNFVIFFQKNKSSLVLAITGVCLRLKMKQAACITALQNALHCTAAQSKSFFECLTKLKPVEVLPYDQETYFSHDGSLIIQDILQFNEPSLLVNSILESPIKFLIEVAQSPGHYVFRPSPAIGEKTREIFVKLFEGFYVDLAVTEYGSIVIERFVKSSNDTIKVAIAKELLAKDNKLKESKFGRIIYKKLRLETFKLSPEQWKASFNVKAEAKTETETKPAKEEDAAEEENGVEESQEDTKTVTTPKSAKKNRKAKKRPAEAKTETETKLAKEEDAADEENSVEESQEDTKTETTPKSAKKNRKAKKRPAEANTETETKPAKEEDAADEENGVEESQEDTKTETTPKSAKKIRKAKKRQAS